MTLNQFKNLMVAIDPKATRYFAPETGNCTVWMEYERIGLFAEGERREPGWRVRVVRYTTEENDSIAEAITKLLESNDEISEAGYTVTPDLNSGYIAHTWLCEVV